MPLGCRLLLLLCFAFTTTAAIAAGALSAVWLEHGEYNADRDAFSASWPQQQAQTLTLNVLNVNESPLHIPPATWFVISADANADRALWRSGFRGTVVSLRAERAWVAQDLKHARWSGIYADADAEQMMDFARAVHGASARVGVAFDRYTVITKSSWQHAARRHELSFQGLYLHEGEFVERLLPRVLRRSDILLITADSQLYPPDVLDNVVMQAMKQGKNVIAGGEAALRSGALFTLLPDASTRAQQAVQLCLALLRGERSRFETAQQFGLLVNQQVLRSMNATFDASSVLPQLHFPLTLPQDVKP